MKTSESINRQDIFFKLILVYIRFRCALKSFQGKMNLRSKRGRQRKLFLRNPRLYLSIFVLWLP